MQNPWRKLKKSRPRSSPWISEDLPVRRVLVDEIISFSKEIYLGITNDRTERKPVIIASGAGGIDIEEVARQSPEKIIKIYLDAPFGLHDFQTRELAIGIDLQREYWKPFNAIAKGLWKAFKENDAAIAEINPLVVTNTGAWSHWMENLLLMTTPSSDIRNWWKSATWTQKNQLRWRLANTDYPI